MDSVSYEMRGGMVVVKESGCAVVFDYESLQNAIDAIVRNREHYAEAIWLRDVAIYRGAMDYLREHLTVADVLEATP